LIYFNYTVLIPYMDGELQHLRLKGDVPVERRALYRMIRKVIKKTFKKTVDNAWVKDQCTILGFTDKQLAEQKTKTTDEILGGTNVMDKLYLSLEQQYQEDATNDGTTYSDTTSDIQTEAAGSAG